MEVSTPQNTPKFQWTRARVKAALLCAEDDLTEEQIATSVGVNRKTLYDWRMNADFQTRVKQHIAELEAAVLKFAIAKKRNRVARQNADWMRLQQIREERAEDPTMRHVPGGETGLVVRQLKMLGVGINAEVIEEFVFDAALVKAQSELEKQASGEVGDDPPIKLRHGGDPENPLVVKALIGVDVSRI